MLKSLFICCLLALFPLRTLADWQPYMINYTIEDGLPSSECYYVLTDKKGYIWVATDYGISCYNGRKFINYVDVLKEKSVILMVCDAKNRIWFISANGLFGYLENGKAVYPKAAYTLKNSMPSREFIISINYDDEGDFWIGTSLNIYEIRRKEEYSKLHDIYGEPKNCERVWSMIREIRPNQFIFGRYNDWRGFNKLSAKLMGLNILFDNKRGRKKCSVEMEYYESFAFFSGLNVNKGKNYVIFKNLMLTLDWKKNPVKMFGPDDVLHFLYEGHDNNFFVTTTNNGVYYFEDGNINRTPQKLLKGQVVGSMTKDRNNGYWFSTTNNGLFYAPDLRLHEFEDLKGIDVKKICSVKNNKFYITNTGKIVLQENGSKNIRELPFTIKQTGYPEEVILVRNKLVYNGVSTGELDLSTNSFKAFKYNNKRIERLDLLHLVDIEKGENEKWFGADVYTLYELKEHVIEPLKIIPAKATKLHFYRAGSELLIGTRKGLYCYRNGSIVAKWKEVFRDIQITDIIETPKGVLCVVTKSAGFFYLKNNEWKQLTHNYRLISDFCKEIKCFKNGTIILLMHGGINYFSIENPEKIVKFSLLDYLKIGEIRSIGIDEDYLEIATSKGSLRLPLSAFSGQKTAPDIYLSNCEFNSVATKRKTFDFGPNSIRFYIDVLDYTKNTNTVYFSKLKGFSNKWKESDAEFLEFTNLPAGEYELLVSTRLANGKLAPAKSLIHFTVLTPFWQTWWFITVLFLAAVSLITGIIVWRIRILNHREAKRNELLRQIAESQVVALRAQMNPHFIFNAINSIQDFVLQNETEDAYSYLSKFARLIRLVMHQSNNNFLTLEQEIDWLKIYMELEKLRFKDKFEFELDVDPDLEMDLQIPNMLIQPHLENAIWHGIMPLRNKRPGKIRLMFDQLDEVLHIEIEDNGVGRGNAPEQKEHESSGVRLVNERIERLGQLENKHFQQEIIDLKDEQGNASGTLVRLTIEFTT